MAFNHARKLTVCVTKPNQGTTLKDEPLNICTMDVNSIAKVTLRSTDFARTERFYHELFGWEFHQYSSTYLGFEPPSGISGGFQHWDSFSQGNSYLLYILVEEFESYLRRIPELGGRCAEEIEVVSESSEYVRFYDPDGNRLALWKNSP